MKAKPPLGRARRRPPAKPMPAARSVGVIRRRAAIFRNGRNQAVRLPQDLAFPQDVKEVQVTRQGDAIMLSPVRPDWASFFALDTTVPDDFLAERGDSPAQSRDPL